MQLRGWWWWGSAFTNVRQEGALGAKSHKSECNGSIRGAPCQTVAEGNGGMWCSCVVEAVVVVGLRVRKREAREEAGAKSHETERDGSISGAPCPTAVEGDGGRWCGCAVEVVVVVGLCVRTCKAGGGTGGQIPQIRAQRLNWGCAVSNGGGGRWGEVVRVCV